MKELRNKDIRDQLKDFPMKAPEGLLDDVKSEMLRRGLSSAPAPSKQKYIVIYRIASVAAMTLILLSISLLWKKEAEIQLESHIIPSSVEETTPPMPAEEEAASTLVTPRPTQALAHTQQVTALHTDTLTTEEENTPGETKEKKEEKKKEQEAPKNQQPEIQEKERHTTPANKEQKWEYTPKRRKTSSFSFGAHLSGLVAQANLSSNQMDMNASASPLTPPSGNPPEENPSGGGDNVIGNDSTSTAVSSRALSRSAKDKVRHHLPIRVGLSFRYSNGQRWYIQSGLTYSYLASDIAYTERTKQKLHYIGIPLQVGSQLWESNRLKGYISIGGQAEKLVSGKATAVSSEGYTSVRRIKDTRLLFSLLGSVGAEYALKKDLSLYVEPEIHYYFKNGNRLLTHYNDQPLNINLTIGFRFHWEK